MDPSPIRLDFDLAPGEAARAGSPVVRLPMIQQGRDQDLELSWLIAEAEVDFTAFDGATLTARATVQDAAPVLTLTAAAGEIVLAVGSITFRFAAAKTSGLALPSGLPRFAGPQIARWGHDVVLTRAGKTLPLAQGVLCMAYAFTRG